MNTPEPIPDDTNGGFRDIPFVAAAFTGRRTFRIVDRAGVPQLLSPLRSYEWSTTEVNEAVCDKGLGYLSMILGAAFGIPTKATIVAGPHKTGAKECFCGFYAYASETPETRTYRNSLSNGFGVEGTIFGFGTATAGTLGFRCSKAKVLGLVKPAACEYPELLDHAMQKFDGVRWYQTFDELAHDYPLTKVSQYGLKRQDDAA